MTQYSDTRRRGLLGMKSRITRQLIIWSLIVGSVASLLISGGEAYLNYQERLNGLDKHLQSVSTYTLPPLVQSLWAFDDQQLQYMPLEHCHRRGSHTSEYECNHLDARYNAGPAR